MVKRRAAGPTGLVLADIPERQRLRDLQQQLSHLRDEIAAVDLEIETLRDNLAAFEQHYHARLRAEHDVVRRTQNMIGHIERWAELLTLRPEPQTSKRAWRMDHRREHELEHEASDRAQRQEASAKAQSDGQVIDAQPEWQPVADKSETLKSAYRDLARRYHPDLARTEEERLQNSDMMARINALYRAGDLERLLALREQARGGEIDAVDLSVEQQLEVLEGRLAWFDAVLKNLHEERVMLEGSATCELWRDVEQARLSGRDLFDELRRGLQERIDRLYDDVQVAIRGLEGAVNRYNRDNAAGSTTPGALRKRDRADGALETYFDPLADKKMVRLGLEQLSAKTFSKAAREEAARIEGYAASDLPTLRLLLLTHVSELSPFPLTGLESYADLETRYNFLGEQNPEPQPRLEAALVAVDSMLEFGVRRATANHAHVGLRFRSVQVRDAIPLAIQSLVVRREFKRVLGVLGERTLCPKCKQEIFAVPLYRTRGLDDMRAAVCPQCSNTLRSYWMPKGKDVQAVLNETFLDYEIISEWSFTLARASVAMQLVPHQVETLRLGDLKKRLVADLFKRYELEVEPSHIVLTQNREVVRDSTPLEELDNRRFTVRFKEDAPMSESDALELVRHRIRNKFSHP